MLDHLPKVFEQNVRFYIKEYSTSEKYLIKLLKKQTKMLK